jgi:hypothetical protein
MISNDDFIKKASDFNRWHFCFLRPFISMQGLDDKASLK